MKKFLVAGVSLVALQVAANAAPNMTPQWGWDSTQILPTGQPLQYKIGTTWTAMPLLAQNNVWTGPTNTFNLVNATSVIIGDNLFLSKASAAIEDGSTSVAGTPYIDFHSSGNNIDYDSRIIASGGTGSAGNGAISILASGGLSVNSSLTLGTNGGTAGSLKLNGSTSGYTTITTNPTTTAYTLQLPGAAPAGANYALIANTSGIASWASPATLINLTPGVTPTSGGAAGQLMYDTGSVLQESANLVFASNTLTVGKATSATGALALGGATSGTATITAQATAGTPILTLPTTTGTLASSASSPLALNATTGVLTCATCVTSSGGGAITGTAPIVVSAAGNVSLQGATGTLAAGSGGTGSSFTATPTLGVAGTTLGTLALAGNTSGTVTLTPQAAAGTPTLTLPNTSGTLVSTASSPLSINATTGAISVTGAAGQILAGATPAFTATPTLGVNATTTGQLGLANGGTTGATVTVQNNGATTAYNFNLPTTVGTAGYLLTSQAGGASAMTWTSPSTTVNGTTCTLGSTCTVTAAASSIPFPQTVSGTVTSGGIPYFNSTTQMSSSAVLAANALVVGGGAGAAPSTITTGTGVVTALGNNTNATGGIYTYGTTLPAAMMPALTGDVTNTAGSLATTVGKIGGNAVSLGGAFTMSGAFTFTGTVTGNTSVTFPTSGTLATTAGTVASFSAGSTGFTPNTATTGAVTLAGNLGLANGGTNASLTASNGGIFYSTGTAGAILAGTATANQHLASGASGAPSWTTATFPATTTAGTILASGSANTVTATATPTLGVQSTTAGTLTLANTNAGAFPTTLASSASSTAAWTLTLPTATPAANGAVLTATTGGVSSWVTSLPVANGGTNCTAASITCFNNITGFTASGTTGTTSTNLVFSTSPTLVTPVLGVATGTSLALGGATLGTNALAVTGTTALSSTLTSAAHTITSSSANALVVGANGTTNPAFNVDASTASSATGLNIKSAAAGSGVALSAISTGTNENMTIDAKGSGTLTLNGTATGAINLAAATNINGVTTINNKTQLTAPYSWVFYASSATPGFTTWDMFQANSGNASVTIRAVNDAFSAANNVMIFSRVTDYSQAYVTMNVTQLSGGGAPSIACTGGTTTGASVAGGSTSNTGQFTTAGPSNTTCTITFSAKYVYPTRSFCTVSPANSGAASITTYYVTNTASTFVLNHATSLGTNTVWNYQCGGN